MAPERFWDRPLYSTAADLWALGCLLYECAAGHAPFLSTSFQELSAAVLEATPSPIPSTPCLNASTCSVGIMMLCEEKMVQRLGLRGVSLLSITFLA